MLALLVASEGRTKAYRKNLDLVKHVNSEHGWKQAIILTKCYQLWASQLHIVLEVFARYVTNLILLSGMWMRSIRTFKLLTHLALFQCHPVGHTHVGRKHVWWEERIPTIHIIRYKQFISSKYFIIILYTYLRPSINHSFFTTNHKGQPG